MKWADIEVVLPEIVEQQGDIPVHWTTCATEHEEDPAHALLDVVSVRSVGRPESRLSYDEGEDHVAQEILSQHVLTVRVTVETESEELEESACAIAQRIKSRLAFDEVQERLLDAGLAIATLGDVLNLSLDDEEESTVSRAAFEVGFNTASLEVGQPLDRVVEVVVEGEARSLGTAAEDPPDLAWTIEVEDDD